MHSQFLSSTGDGKCRTTVGKGCGIDLDVQLPVPGCAANRNCGERGNIQVFALIELNALVYSHGLKTQSPVPCGVALGLSDEVPVGRVVFVARAWNGMFQSLCASGSDLLRGRESELDVVRPTDQVFRHIHVVYPVLVVKGCNLPSVQDKR